ncbi:MAG: DNA/RNA non-specific endonuclease, partial [Lentisphaeria bacterium]|nr:DNA/RNA non-specific endonuclease [Lentisphaeria bacterium]
CTAAYACVGPDLTPEGDRESISEIRPTGWHIVKYDGIDGNYLYNRCHLIAYGLTAENANERNLITGTRYMNTVGMNDFENETIAYIRRTGRHVLYRVTPVFEGSNLVASGVLMEGLSIEDPGPLPAVRFCIYAYNVQPGVTIDLATGESTGALFTGSENAGSGAARQETDPTGGSSGTAARSDAGFVEPAADVTYVININSGKFHRPDCPSVRDMNQHNRRDSADTREDLVARGFEPCGKCRP